MQRASKFYERLLKLYPARFREEYETPMEIQFCDDYRDTASRVGRVRFWLRVLWDLAWTTPGKRWDELKLDLKHAVRVYRRNSLSLVLALLALSLAIGASTGIFSVLNALLLRSLPFSDPDRLVELWLSPVSPPVSPIDGRAAFTAWRRNSLYLQDAAAFSSSEMNLTGQRNGVRVKVSETTGNFFQLLRIRPAAGRTFTPDEDIFGHTSVAVISYGLWQQMFGGAPDIAGRSLLLNGLRLTVIGVAPARFDYPGKTALWVPSVFDFERIPKRGAFMFETIGRLKPAISIRQAKELFLAEVRRVSPALLKGPRPDEQNRPHLTSLQNQLAGSVREASWVLAGMTLLVLLTACANVAQLLLSRATERREELSLRTALGASRARLVQQLITEAMLLTIIGAALGLSIAHWTSGIAASVTPAQLATQAYTVLDWRVLSFAIALALGMGLLFGVIPAWLIGRLQPSSASVRTQPGLPQRRTKHARNFLIALQAALTLALVTSSFSMGSAFLQLLHVDLGFHPSNVITLSVSLQGTVHRGPGEWQYYSDVLHRLRKIPGVEAAGAVSHLPLADEAYMASSFKLDSGQTVERVIMNAVMPGYFRAMGTTLLAGRDFAGNENNQLGRFVIVDEAFAQRSGLGTRIVGRKLKAPWSGNLYQIAGVVSAIRSAGPAHSGEAEIYWPIAEEPPAALTFVAGVRGEPERFLAQCRDAVRSLDRTVPVYDVKTLDQRLQEVLSRPRFYTTATFFLAALGTLLAMVGVYGTAAFAIAQRKHEVGVRMAVGASQLRVRTMMLRESLLPVVSGTIAGMAIAAMAERSLGHLLEGAAETGLSIHVAAAGLMLLAGLLAAWHATGKVLSIQPIEALRAQ